MLWVGSPKDHPRESLPRTRVTKTSSPHKSSLPRERWLRLHSLLKDRPMARCNKRLASCQAAFLFSRKSIKPMSPPPKIGRRCFEQGSILDPNNLVDWRGQSIWILYWSRQKGSQFEKEKRNVLMNASNWWHWGCGGAIETALNNFNQRSWQQELTRTFYYWTYSSAIDISLLSVFSKSLDNLNYWKLFKDPVDCWTF